MNDFSKVVRLGTMPAGYPERQYSIFAEVEFKAGKLSISGVIGPKANGDCHGSCGQFIMSFKEYDERGHATLADIIPAPGWTAETIKQFFDAWDEWHLNDMRADCVHQRATWNTSEKIEVLTYHLTREARQMREDARAIALRAGLTGEPRPLSPTYRALAELDSAYAGIHFPPDADSPLSGCYEVTKRETKTAGWVRPEEHPRGLLCKPCEVCGYKYGSAWLREEVPTDVLAFLQGLPDTDVKPAWV